jgi:hypothetical protein
MRTYRILCAMLCLLTFLLCAAPVGAQTNSGANFSGPVQLPRMVLPAGAYTFRLAADGGSVVVYDAKRRIVTTLQVVPITRAAAGDVIVMRAAVGTAAPEISALYTGGGTAGVEFLYSPVAK